MSSHLDGDMIFPPEAPGKGVIPLVRVWQHRHDLELKISQPRYNRSILLTLGVGGLLLGAICMLADQQAASTHGLEVKGAIQLWSEKWESVFGKIRRENREREHRSDSAFRYDTLTSDLLHQKDAGMSTELQDSLDATPVPAPVTLSKTETPETPLAYTVIPTKRPVLENGKSVQSKRMDQISATNRADAIRYDQCKPECDISNRRIVVTALAKKTASPSQFPVETTDFKSINQTSEIGAAVLNGAGVVLAQTIALPFTTLKLGRDAVSRVSDMN